MKENNSKILGYKPLLTNESTCNDNQNKLFANSRKSRQKFGQRSKFFSAAKKSDKTIDFQFDCNLVETNMQPYLGSYEHPMFGVTTVSYANGTMRWTFGYFGRGSLCKTIPNSGAFNILFEEIS